MNSVPDRKTMDDMIKILESGMARLVSETEEEPKDLSKESGTSRCEDKD